MTRTLAPCLHCRATLPRQGRGLCGPCYSDEAVRYQYPPLGPQPRTRRNPPGWTDEQIASLRQMVAANHKIVTMARRLGFCTTKVTEKLQALQIGPYDPGRTTPRRNAPWTGREIALLRELYRGEDSVEAIARKLERPPSIVGAMARQQGLAVNEPPVSVTPGFALEHQAACRLVLDEAGPARLAVARHIRRHGPATGRELALILAGFPDCAGLALAHPWFHFTANRYWLTTAGESAVAVADSLEQGGQP